MFSLLSPLWEKDARKTLLLWKKIMSTADHELTMAALITIMRKVLISQIFPEYASSLPITPKQREQ